MSIAVNRGNSCARIRDIIIWYRGLQICIIGMYRLSFYFVFMHSKK